MSKTEMPLWALHRPRMFGPDIRVARDLGHGLHENVLINPSRQGTTLDRSMFLHESSSKGLDVWARRVAVW